MNKFITAPFNHKMIKIVAFFTLFLCSCGANKAMHTDSSFNTIYSSAYGGANIVSFVHITNNNDYIKFIETLHIDVVAYSKLINVNFKENTVIVLNQGTKNSGGYAVNVESVRWEDEILVVVKKEMFPKKGEQVTNALSAPYCIAVIPNAKHVKVP